MLFFLIFIKLIFFTIETKIQDDHLGIIDAIFNNNIDTQLIYTSYCKLYNHKLFTYRGRPTNIKDIINTKTKEDYSNYKYVYISELKYLDKVVEFPKSTIFFTFAPITVNERQYNKEYCYIDINWALEDYAPFYYINIGLIAEEQIKSNGTIILIILFFITLVFYLTLLLKSCSLGIFEDLIFYKFAIMILALSMLINFSCLLINIFLLSILFYSFFKSYMIISLFFYVDGYMNLHYDYLESNSCRKSLLLFVIIESLCNVFFLYIIYFFPTVNNYNLFISKSLLEHIVLLLQTIKCIKRRLIPLYNQYLFETKLKTILAIDYKAKLIIYLKIVIFSLIYNIGFIILPFIEIYLSIPDLAQVFYYHYYINVGLEILYGNILGILFYPLKVSVLYFLPIKYDYNSRKMIVKINKEEKNNNISNLSKRLLKTKYKEEQLPIILLKPFSRNNNIVYKDIIIGNTENNN